MPAAAQEISMRVLSVTGQGRVPVQTTKAQVELGVEVQGRTADSVQQRVAERSAKLVALLRDQSVENLQTTGVRLNPQYNYESGQGRLVGYIGENTVSFEAPTTEVGTLLDAAIASGATQISGIQFTAEEAAIAAAREVALQEATADAQTQAEIVLSSLGLPAEEIVGIQIGRLASRPPAPVLRSVETAESARFDTPVVAGEQMVEATVTLQIRY